MEVASVRDARPSTGWRAAAIAVGLGVLFDAVTYDQLPGAGLSVFLLATVALCAARVRLSADDALLLTTAGVLALCVAVRAAPWLVALDLLAALACVAIVVTPSAAPFVRSGLVDLLTRAVSLALAALRAPGFLLAPLGAVIRRTPARHIRPALRAIGIVGPILALFAALLASADRVFGELITPDLPAWNGDEVFAHLVLIAFGTIGAATLLRAAIARAAGDRVHLRVPAPPAALRRGDLLLLLGGLATLFALFVGVQLATLFGGDGHVQVTPGLTYAEYARSGFAQLMAVAALTIPVIVASWDLGAPGRDAPWYRPLVAALVGLTCVILASSWARLTLYQEAFGFTVARLVAYAVMAWTAAVLAILVVALWTRNRRQVVASSIVAALVVLLALNGIDADRFVAERNIERYRITGKIDAAYLGAGLGPDAIPSAAPLLRTLRRGDRAVLLEALCSRATYVATHDWRSANLGRARAHDALRAAGVTLDSCA